MPLRKIRELFVDLETKPLPAPPSWKKAFGVGVVVMGLAIGTGELIMWPYLVTKYGLDILWGALMGILLQYFINKEVARTLLYSGESFFVTTTRLFPYLGLVWIVLALLLYLWPGWAGAIGTALAELVGKGSHIFWARVSLLSILLLTFLGKRAYYVLESSLKIIVPVFFSLLLIISFWNLNFSLLWAGIKGITKIGYLPGNIELDMFLGAVVFAGAGGLLNLAVSLWYRDKGFGMGAYMPKIENPITGKPGTLPAKGYIFKLTPENKQRWKKWMRLVFIDQGVIFLGMGFLTLFLLALNSFAVLSPLGKVPEGLKVAVVQAEIFAQKWGKPGYNLFLAMSSLMLFSVMWTLIDAVVRIISDTIYMLVRIEPFSEHFKKLQTISLSSIYYVTVTFFVLIASLLLPLKAPLFFLKLSAVLGAGVMGIYVLLILLINNLSLPSPLRPSLLTNLFLLTSSLFYLITLFFVLK